MRIFYQSEMRKMNGKLQYHQSTKCFGRGGEGEQETIDEGEREK